MQTAHLFSTAKILEQYSAPVALRPAAYRARLVTEFKNKTHVAVLHLWPVYSGRAEIAFIISKKCRFSRNVIPTNAMTLFTDRPNRPNAALRASLLLLCVYVV